MKILIKDISIIPMSESFEKILHNKDIYIEDGIIKDIGEDLNYDYDNLIEGTNLVATPGFINTHTHVPMSLFRETSESISLQNWLKDLVWPIEKKLNKDDVYYASLLSGIEAIENGITTLNDHYFYTEEIIKAMDELGVNLISTSYLMKKDGEEKLNNLDRLINDYKEKKFTLGIHSLYTSDDDYIKKCTEYNKEKKLPIHMHFCENKREREDIKRIYNVNSPGEVLEKYFEGFNIVLAHCVKLDDNDFDTLKRLNVSVSHCPISNLRLGCGFANIARMKSMGINVTLGTDGQGSGSNMNMLEAMRMSNYIARGLHEENNILSAYDSLKMATINGAKALGLNNTGSIEIGKKSDIILFDLSETHFNPINNIISNIVYNATPSDIDTVIIGNNIVKRNKKIIFENKTSVINKCNSIIQALKD